MRQPSRRTVLASTLAIVLGGCTNSGSDDEGEDTDGTPESGDASSGETPSTTPTAEPTPTRTPEETATVHEGYETTGVTARTAGGTELGSVTAAIADTRDLRYLGLSDTEELPPDRGMLFVFDAAAARTFVMREMDFGIDIVYADPAGVITGIHHAPAPGPDENGSQQRYPGQGQYVLEVNRHWTTEHGVEAGDVLEFEL